jgi:hypothetical protein
MFSRFIGGFNIQQLKHTLDRCQRNNWMPILDLAKEGSKSKEDVDLYMKQLQSLYNLSPTYALKLSSFDGRHQAIDAAIQRLINEGNAKRIYLDAEHIANEHRERLIYNNLIKKYNEHSCILYKTYQMYKFNEKQHMLDDMKYLPNVGIKIVRGAYHVQDKDSGRLFVKSSSTHDQFNDAIFTLLSHPQPVQFIIATHNAHSISLATRCLFPEKQQRLEFAQLLGMRDDLGIALTRQGHAVSKYVPYGSFADLMPYLIRRLYENYEILQHVNFQKK